MLEELNRWSTLAPGATLRRIGALEEEGRADRHFPAIAAAAKSAIVLRGGQVPGRATCPVAVDGGPTWVKGVLVELVARDIRVGPSPDREAAARLRRILSALAAVTGESLVEDLAVELDASPGRVPGGEFQFEGGSADLAGLVAVVSYLIDVPAPAGRLHSATLVDALAGPVADRWVGAKLEIVGVEHPGAELWFGPGTGGRAARLLPPELDPILRDLFGHDWRERVLDAVRSDIRRRMGEAWKGFRENQWTAAHRSYSAAARAAFQTTDVATFALATQFVGVCLVRLGQVDRGIAYIELADSMFRGGLADGLGVPGGRAAPYRLASLSAFLGSALQADLKPRAARELLEPLLDGLLEDPHPEDAHWRLTCIEVAGTLARSLRAFGEHEEGVRLYEEVCVRDCGLERERTRTSGDLADSLRRGGDLAAARDRLDQAWEAVSELQDEGYRRGCEPYLELHEIRLLLDEGKAEEASRRAEAVVRGEPDRMDARLMGCRGAIAMALSGADREVWLEAARSTLGAATNAATAPSPVVRWVAAVPLLSGVAQGRVEATDAAWKELQAELGTWEFDLDELETARQAVAAGGPDEPRVREAAALLVARSTH